MSDLYRLVYSSRNLLAKVGQDAAEAVEQILAASQRNNSRVGVTGALLFNGGAFAQVLEGPRRSVEDTFERIQRDLRHSDVTVLQCGPVESRGFANWSMAFVGQSARGQSLWSRLAAESGFDHARLDGDAVFQMLHGLVLEEEGSEGTPERADAAVAARPAAPAATAIAPEPSFAASPAASRAPAADLPRPPGARRGSRAATEAALAVFRVALASERALTTELRTALDELQAEAATFRDQIETLRGERNLWADRFRQLAETLCAEAEALGDAADAADAVEAEPALLRGAA